MCSRKRHRTTSTSKSSPVAKKEVHEGGSEIKDVAPDTDPPTQSRSHSKSLSPLSTKMEMQEGNWQPPTTINTTSSFIPPNLAIPPPSIETNYSYPPPGWPPTTMVTVPPVTTMYPPPTAYGVMPQGLIHSILVIQAQL